MAKARDRKEKTIIITKHGGRPVIFKILETKKEEAKKKLSDCFVAFIKNGKDGYFICSSPVSPFLCEPRNFSIAIVAPTNIEINTIDNIFTYVASFFFDLFSKKDFHSTMLLDYFSRCLREILFNHNIPEALAVEMIIRDMGNNIFLIHFDGENEIEDLDDTKQKIFLAGFYNPRRDELLKILEQAPDIPISDKERIEALQKQIKETFGLKDVRFID